MSHAVDHIQLSVEDYPRAKAFYAQALAPLGFTLMMEFPEQGPPSHGGFGAMGKPFLWITGGTRQTPTTHIAFGARSAEEVNAFYQAAMAAGGTDNGPPGTRALYHPKYYAAFVRDPEGHNIEAVWHGTVEAAPEKAPVRKAAARKKPAAKKAARGRTPAKRASAKKAPARKAAAKRKPAARKRPTAKRRKARR